MSPVYYVNHQPPGLTPPRYPQKSYSYVEPSTGPTNIEFSNPSPQPYRTETLQQPTVQPMSYLYVGSPDLQMQQNYQQMYQSPSNANNLYLKRTGNNKSLTLSASSGEFNYIEPQQQMYMQPRMQPEKKKPIILEESMQRYTGRLKFFDENKNYGFIIMDEDGSDIFVHFDDLSKAGINKDLLKTARMGNVIKLAFSCMKYVGKYDRSRKATDIQLLA